MSAEVGEVGKRHPRLDMPQNSHVGLGDVMVSVEVLGSTPECQS